MFKSHENTILCTIYIIVPLSPHFTTNTKNRCPIFSNYNMCIKILHKTNLKCNYIVKLYYLCVIVVDCPTLPQEYVK